jgi:hypothetical protein
MAYRIPIDLPLVDTQWQDWPISARLLTAAAIRPAASIRTKLAAVAITLNEQPGKTPVNNCCGLMCQDDKYPWGWSGAGWGIDHPVGYALIREGATGKEAPFLAFAKVEDSLGFLIDRVTAREMFTADVYATRWVGVTPGSKAHREAVDGFNVAYTRVAMQPWPDEATA